MGVKATVRLYLCNAAGVGEERLAGVEGPRRERAEGMKNAAARRQALAAAWLMSRVFPENYAKERRDARGKPWIPGGPQYSLSHAGDWVALAVGEEGDGAAVGCDIERARARALPEGLLRKAMTEGERRRIAVSRAPWNAFLRRWVIKEAFTKAMGRGLQIPFGEVETRLSPPGVAGAPGAWGAVACRVACPKGPEGYRVAVCRAGGEGFRVVRCVTGECGRGISQTAPAFPEAARPAAKGKGRGGGMQGDRPGRGQGEKGKVWD